MDLNKDTEYQFREDEELPLCGIYVSTKTQKFQLEKRINGKQLKIFLSCLFICSNLSVSSVRAKSLSSQQSISSVEIFQKKGQQIDEKKSKIFNPKKKMDKKTENEKFDPFNAEIREEIEKNEKFILELEKFKKEKLSNEKNFSFKSSNCGILVKRNPFILLGNNNLTEKFSKEEKKSLTEKFRSLVVYAQNHKLLIFSFFIGSLLIIIYFVLKANKILFLEKTKQIIELKAEKFKNIIEPVKTLVNSGENFSTEIPVKEISFLEVENSSNLEVSEQEISSLEVMNSSNLEISEQEISSLEVNTSLDLEISEQENIIFPKTKEISLSKVEQMRTCIEHGEILKAEEALFVEDMANLNKVKEYFLEYGDEMSATHEEWMHTAKGIKAEMDKLLQSRIEWEKALEKYLETCH